MFTSIFARILSRRRKRIQDRPRRVRDLRSPEKLECRLALSTTIGDAGSDRVLHQRVEGTVGYFDSQDVYQFELAESSYASIQLSGLRADVDVELYDNNFRQIGSSDNPDSQSETLSARLSAGVYYARVFPYRFYDSSPYQLEIIAAPAVQPDNAGNSFSSARELGHVSHLQSLHDSVGPADSRDFYRFEVEGDEEVHLYLGDLNEDVDLYLFNSSRSLIAQSRNPRDWSEFLSVDLTAGTYYALVAPYGEASSTYTLSMRSLGGPSADPTPMPSQPRIVPPGPSPVTTPSAPINVDPGTNVPAFTDVAYYGGPNDWNLNAINAPEVWSEGFAGQDIVVAVVDTGVDLSHPELTSRLWVNADEVPGNRIDDDRNGYTDDVYGWDFAYDDNDPTDRNGHGTHVAGTIAALRNSAGATGVAYGATIMPVQVLGVDGSGSVYDVAAGIRYAVDNGADVINLSLGGPVGTGVLLAALQYAESHGVLVAAASGNEGLSNPDYPARYSSSLSNVISVGAYDNRLRIAGFSNGVSSSDAVQVDAPGVGILSTVGNSQYATLSGTSMATPHVAGLAALALSANPDLTANQLRTLVVDGTDRDVAGSDSYEGVNAALTVARALAATGPFA